MSSRFKSTIGAGTMALAVACAPVGPDYVKPEVALPDAWSTIGNNGLEAAPIDDSQWWHIFEDPILDKLVETAWLQNISIEIAGLRVL